MNTQLTALLKPSDSTESAPGRAHDPPTTKSANRLAAALPWLMLLGFLGLLAVVLGNRLLPAKLVTTATVVTVRQNADAAAQVSKATPASNEDAPMLFQASGWIEPDPFPTLATALVDGVIESVDVLEGDIVEKGQLLATMIDDDAQLNLATAASQLDSLHAQCEGHIKQIAIVEAQKASLSKQIAVAEARRDEAADVATRLKSVSKGGVAALDLSKARLEHITTEAEVEAMAVTGMELEARLSQLEEIQADFTARIAEAETDVARKQLALDRTRIEAPIAGRVLKLHAVPGNKKMLGMDMVDSATIATLYDPDELQARIDVPLAEAAQITVGQPVRIRSEILPGKIFQGRVTRIVGEADLQRNTLQVKVQIDAPDDRLRPEMLCRAEFLAAAETTKSDATPVNSGGNRVQIFVPIAALPEGSADQSEATVWKTDSTGDHVVPQTITLGREIREDHRLLLDGLRSGDRVVLNPPSDLNPGDRIRQNEES